MELREVLSLISKGVAEKAESRGFKAVKPVGIDSGELPVFEQDKETYLLYKGEKGYIKICFEEDKAYFMIAEPTEDEPSFKSVAASIFECETADEKEVKYIINEYNDCIEEKFKNTEVKKGAENVKLPTPVSKAAAKSGSSFYDPITLASRYTVLYSDLREKYKENIDTYGQFLPDEFFREYGSAAIDTIRQNDKQQMKKLFTMLNEIYLDGTNETQSIIAVTILGQLDNDQVLIANCLDYMDRELMLAVVNVNKYLATSAGKKAKKLIQNPPAYKPPKNPNQRR